MGFWGKLGKIALKVAPIAASFIPGVGPLAGMAISGAANAASKKLEGGSWKQALGAGAMGAGTSALGSALSGAKLKDLGKLTATKGAPMTLGQQIGRAATAGMSGMGAIQNVLSQPGNNQSSGQGIGPSTMPQYNNTSTGGGRQNDGPSRNTMRGSQSRGLPYGIGAGQTPNLGAAFASGRQIAMANQPFRAGAPPYQRMNDETGLMEDIPGDTGRPPIYPNLQGDNMFGLNGGGIGPSRPPTMQMQGGGGGMGRPPSYGSPGGQYGGQPGVPRNNPMGAMQGAMNGRGGPGSQMGRAMMGMGQQMGMGGGSQYNAPGMGQFNPGMSMIPQQMMQNRMQETAGQMGIGPSQQPAAMPMENDPNAPPMGQKIDTEKSPVDMGSIGPSTPMTKPDMMQAQPIQSNYMPQPQQRMFGRGGMQRNQPMGGMMY